MAIALVIVGLACALDGLLVLALAGPRCAGDWRARGGALTLAAVLFVVALACGAISHFAGALT